MSVFRILLISEFPAKSGAPTGALASDLTNFLHDQAEMSVRFIKAHGAYRPGGMRPSRLWNLIYLHCILFLLLPYERVMSIARRQRICIIATTSPPLIHWTSGIIGSALRIPVLLWYQDAHPEIEARVLSRKNWNFASKILRMFDKLVATTFTSLITLDHSMLRDFLKRTGFKGRSEVIPPWSTYIEPALPLRLPSDQSHLKMLYAGNYGKVHDLSPLARKLSSLGSKQIQELSLTFVGMNSESQANLARVFSQSGIQVRFKERFATVGELVATFPEYDLGIVSLAQDSKGLACPSKALSYLSQGLPLLYVGPEDTLPWHLCKNGWGILTDNFVDSSNWPRNFHDKDGSLFHNPKVKSLETFLILLQEAVKDHPTPVNAGNKTDRVHGNRGF